MSTLGSLGVVGLAEAEWVDPTAFLYLVGRHRSPGLSPSRLPEVGDTRSGWDTPDPGHRSHPEKRREIQMAQLAEDFKIIDADTHYTEPYDLWTSRAPKGYENRVFHMEEREGLPTWVVDGNEIGFARGGGVVARDSSKLPFLDSMEMGLDWV